MEQKFRVLLADGTEISEIRGEDGTFQTEPSESMYIATYLK